MLGRLTSLLASRQAPLAGVELFAWGNLAFLAVDVYIAHSANSFALTAEWIPVYFSLVAPPVLILAMLLQRSVCPSAPEPGESAGQRVARWLGLLVGGGSILVGIAGLLWHLDSQFFELATIKSLIYTAPFLAPLAYTGVGFLLLLDRMMPGWGEEWGCWVVLLALGGFVGNLGLSLADHAQNAFFEWREWIPVVAAAIAVGNLTAVVFIDHSRSSLRGSAVVMLLQALVGLAGWYFHIEAIFASPMDSLWDKVVYSAPLFAPLLFVNLALLAGLGLWALARLDPCEGTTE